MRALYARVVPSVRRLTLILAGVLATMVSPIVPPATAQLAPQQPQRVQIAGTRVTFIPAPGLRSPPGAAIMVRSEDGLAVMVTEMKTGELEATTKALTSPAVQQMNQLSNVEVSLRPQGAIKRAFIKMLVTEKVGVQYREIVLIDDGRSAASVAANVSKKAFDADPNLAVTMNQMLGTVSFTDKKLELSYSFKLVPPPGYRPIGAASGQMQLYGAGEREYILAIRLERPIAPANISSAADVVVPRTLEMHFHQLETLKEIRTRSGEWEYYEREFKGVHKKLGVATEGLIRQQTNTANESYIVFGFAFPPLTEGMKARMRTAFESVRATSQSSPRSK